MCWGVGDVFTKHTCIQALGSLGVCYAPQGYLKIGLTGIEFGLLASMVCLVAPIVAVCHFVWGDVSSSACPLGGNVSYVALCGGQCPPRYCLGVWFAAIL